MADITPIDNPTLTTLTPPLNCKLSGLTYGEEIADAMTPVYIKSDGKLYKSAMGGDPAAEAAHVDGWVALPGKAGDKGGTIYWDVVVNYGSGLTPGARFWLSNTAGLIADAKQAADVATNWIAKAIDATRIQIRRSLY